ncbi:cupin domain-containing protein [Beijerinckia sp. L45]|uniref:cupin domain-containing protein n=1 Tax=Beijerinckia sp. L45 TaxID=1641855 RepID=UPI00131C9B71|nr:cupin domain-containing protein [Beijerinckia sp. L45]
MTDFSVTAVETIVESSDVLARVFTLMPGDVIPWHYHSESADYFFVLEGDLTIVTTDASPAVFKQGDRYQVASGVRHQVSNEALAKARFLLLQGVGRNDFIKS